MVRPYRKCEICGLELESEIEKQEHLKKLSLNPEHFKKQMQEDYSKVTLLI